MAHGDIIVTSPAILTVRIVYTSNFTHMLFLPCLNLSHWVWPPSPKQRNSSSVYGYNWTGEVFWDLPRQVTWHHVITPAFFKFFTFFFFFLKKIRGWSERENGKMGKRDLSELAVIGSHVSFSRVKIPPPRSFWTAAIFGRNFGKGVFVSWENIGGKGRKILSIPLGLGLPWLRRLMT